MTDINQWSISDYRSNGVDADYEFGSMADGSPFTVQVEISDADAANNDVPHGYADATLMGIDQILATNLTFSITTLPGDDTQKWNDALDKVSEFASVWRANRLRRLPGQYAILTNIDRQRWTWGRPRNFAPKHSRMRRGIIEYVAQFRTSGPYWFGVDENELNVPPTTSTVQHVGGDEPAYPIFTFQGPFSTASLAWFPNASILTPAAWTLSIPHALAGGDTIRIDTRPEQRSATDGNGLPRNGWLTGTKMSDCFLDPSNDLLGDGHFVLTATGATDVNTHVNVAWFDTFAGL